MEQSIQGYLGSLQLGEIQLFKNMTMVPVRGVTDERQGLLFRFPKHDSAESNARRAQHHP